MMVSAAAGRRHDLIKRSNVKQGPLPDANTVADTHETEEMGSITMKFSQLDFVIAEDASPLIRQASSALDCWGSGLSQCASVQF